MQPAEEINHKIAILLCNIIGNCIQKARIIPYILKQEEVIDILVENPALFESLVQKEQSHRIGDSKKNLAVSFDAILELQKHATTDLTQDMIVNKTEDEITAIIELINKQIKTFNIYINNAFTFIDKQIDEFTDRYRQSLRQNGIEFKTIDLTIKDFKIFEDKAHSYLKSGEFVQAFLFDRLLSDTKKIRDLIRIPGIENPLRQSLIRSGLSDARLSKGILKFIIRVSYLSQGNWHDLFQCIDNFSQQKSGLMDRSKLVDQIHNDIAFCCNFLRMSFTDFKERPAEQIRSDIVHCLDNPMPT